MAKGFIADIGLTTPRRPLPKAKDGDAISLAPGCAAPRLDFQNDVTVKVVQQAATENFRLLEHMERYTSRTGAQHISNAGRQSGPRSCI
ncbi:hypothetical protein ROLI_024950 [Roseobacter fucihabitans]|uniref:SoxA A3 domain-containing protein n=1 Tax=Roseobacter fucihabitans TaxID=1537242 RepID=A0ABZ2BU89_9RHOB|nr:hypothetical protein [Roseobacter litoralis]